MGPKENRIDQYSLKHLGGQVLVLLTFMLNLLTTVGVVWTIFRLGLNTSDPQKFLFSIDSNPGAPLDEILLFHRDIVADTLVMKDRLGVDMIDNEQIALIGSNSNNNRVAPAGIFLSPDHVSMQAKSFGADGSPDSQYGFQIYREVDKFDVSSDINNVRSIRSPMKTNEDGFGGYHQHNREQMNSDLEIRSPDQLELSGNLGANFHSKHMELVSKDKISIESKERVIIIRSSEGGLYLPNLQFFSGDYEQKVAFDDSDNELNFAKNFISRGPINRQSQLCVSKSDGMLYRSQVDCQQ